LGLPGSAHFASLSAMLRKLAYLPWLAAPLFLFSALAQAAVVEQVIVAINAEPYTLSDVKDYARTKMARPFPQGDLDPIGRDDIEVLEQFITERLLEAEIKRLDIKVSDQDIDRYIDQIKQRNRLTDEQLRAALSRDGMSLEKYRDSVRAEIEKSEIINRQVRKRVNIMPEDIERYYRLNQKKFRTKERARLRHILLPLPEGAAREREKETFEKGAKIRARAVAGEDFAKLAREYSQGGSPDGGDIGWVTRGSLLKEIEEIAFEKLALGEVSQPFRTKIGVHLVKLEDKEPSRSLPLEEVSENVKAELQAKALEERFQKWLKSDLRRRHRVDVKLPGVVFRAEDVKEETVGSLIASSSKRDANERSFWSYLNPLSYILSTSPVEGEEAEAPSGKNVVSVFGIPLFVSESAGDVPQDPLAPIEPKESPSSEPEKKSGGFFSSIWKALNPFD